MSAKMIQISLYRPPASFFAVYPPLGRRLIAAVQKKRRLDAPTPPANSTQQKANKEWEKRGQTRFSVQRTPHRQLQRENRITVPMTDPIGPPIERAHIILRRHRPREVPRRGGPARHLARASDAAFQRGLLRHRGLRRGDVGSDVAPLGRGVVGGEVEGGDVVGEACCCC